MNLDELQSIRDRERQSDSLQQLRESFYEDVGAFLEDLREEREAAAERADDPFDAPEVNRLTDDIKTAEQTVEAIYERRVGKLVKMASFAAADMPTDDEGLTAEERDLFEHLVASIEHNREQVFAVIDGEEPPAGGSPDGPTSSPEAGDESPAPSGQTGEPASQDAGVDAADLMGADPSAADSDSETSPPVESGPGEAARDSPTAPESPHAGGTAGADDDGVADRTSARSSDGDGSRQESHGRETPASATGSAGGSDSTTVGRERDAADSGERSDGAGSTDGGADVSRTTVRITRDVGEIFGVDEREYDLSPEDVVTLPAANAEPLVERDAAERID